MGTSKKLTGNESNDPTLFAEDTLVSLSALQDNDEVKTTNGICGPTFERQLATFDRDTQSWKTSGDISLWEEQPSLEILPLSGTTRNGTLFERPLLEHLIVENGCSLWPTPTSAAWTVATSMDAARRMVATRGPSSRLTEEVATTEPESNGFLNPEWVEWLMGFPPGWTDLKD